MNQPANRAGGRGAGGGRAGARGAILLAVAAVLGIVLLQAFDTDFDGAGVGIDVGTTLPSGGSTGSTLPSAPSNTTSTIGGRAPAEVAVLVANGTGIRGLGGQTAETLKALGYNTLTAVDSTRALEASAVQYAEGYESEARAIALTLGLLPTAAQPLNSPAVPDTQGAQVIVLLGADVARTSSTSTP
ncbi:MAG: hypothetical protein QOE93_1350 [Actinomycetota bacterium]|nr:hypothetical protein [Actinomycetota bacterium]